MSAGAAAVVDLTDDLVSAAESGVAAKRGLPEGSAWPTAKRGVGAGQASVEQRSSPADSYCTVRRE